MQTIHLRVAMISITNRTGPASLAKEPRGPPLPKTSQAFAEVLARENSRHVITNTRNCLSLALHDAEPRRTERCLNAQRSLRCDPFGDGHGSLQLLARFGH